MKGREDLNVRGAYLHLLSDAAISVGVAVTGVLLSYGAWPGLDPLVSIGIVVAMVIGTWGLLKETVKLALNAVPPHIDCEAVERFLAGQPGIVSVHELHIWGMSTTETALTAHLVAERHIHDEEIRRINRELKEHYRIHHVTLQIERGHCDTPRCALLKS